MLYHYVLMMLRAMLVDMALLTYVLELHISVKLTATVACIATIVAFPLETHMLLYGAAVFIPKFFDTNVLKITFIPPTEVGGFASIAFAMGFAQILLPSLLLRLARLQRCVQHTDRHGVVLTVEVGDGSDYRLSKSVTLFVYVFDILVSGAIFTAVSQLMLYVPDRTIVLNLFLYVKVSYANMIIFSDEPSGRVGALQFSIINTSCLYVLALIGWWRCVSLVHVVILMVILGFYREYSRPLYDANLMKLQLHNDVEFPDDTNAPSHIQLSNVASRSFETPGEENEPQGTFVITDLDDYDSSPALVDAPVDETDSDLSFNRFI